MSKTVVRGVFDSPEEELAEFIRKWNLRYKKNHNRQ